MRPAARFPARPIHLVACAFALTLAWAPPALAESVTETGTAGGGRFWEHPASGIPLEAGETLSYSWRATRADGQPSAVIFNVHYGEVEGDPTATKYAVESPSATNGTGSVTAPEESAYFLMWENRNPFEVRITVTYETPEATGGPEKKNGKDTPAPALPALAGLAAAGLLASRRRRR